MSLKVGSIVKAKVTGITKFGAFVQTPEGEKGMIHISEISTSYVEDIKSVLKIGQAVSCKVISISDEGKVAMSMKQAESEISKTEPSKSKQNRPQRKKYTPAPAVTSPGSFEWQPSSAGSSFEDMMSKFKRTSEDKMSDLKRGESRGYSRRGNGGRR